MPRPVKLLGGIFVGALVVVAVLMGVLYAVGGSWMSATYTADVAPVAVPSDSASVAWGEHIAQAVAGCTGCHGEDMGGMVLVDSGTFARWLPPNLTSGEGSVVGDYTPEDWVRAVRHAIAPDGRGLIMMPATGYYHLADADIGALIAYIRSLPPVDRTMEPSTLNVIGRVAMVMGGAPFLVAKTMDHDAPRMPKPAPGVTVAYGDYLARVCAACHGTGMEGDIGPDLRPASAYSHVNQSEFFQIMRTGVNAAGQQMDPQHMPWPNFGRMTDPELGAIWTYLESLPAER